MKIDPKATFLGLPILTIRDFLKRALRHYGSSWPETFLSRVIKLDAKQSQEVIEELAKQGFIEKAAHYSGEQHWQTTIKGNSLAMASAARPVTRATADRVFAEFMERVQKVNEDPYFLFRVTTVVLFGSYIRDTPTVNDIDVAVRITAKEKDVNRRTKLSEKRRRESNRTLRNLANFGALPIIEVWMFLKSRSHVISLHDFDQEAKLLKTIEIEVVLAEKPRIASVT